MWRSTGNYNAVVNNAMMAMYQETGDEAFLGYVERNLSMMLTYMDPDDTIFTQNSTRQDQGKLEYADKYFYQYLYMCSREKNPAFDGCPQDYKGQYGARRSGSRLSAYCDEP